MRNFKELKIWQKGFDIAVKAFTLTATFPKEEKFGISSQMTRAAISIPSNIAEGCGRNGLNEFYQFLGIASGSHAELKTQLLIALDIFSKLSDSIKNIVIKLDDIGRMLNGLKKSIHEQRTTSNEQRPSRTTNNGKRENA